MTRPRYPHPDANQAEIVQALQACGFLVLDVSRTLATPDIFVHGYHIDTDFGYWTAWEIKTLDGELTETQKRFMATWPGTIEVARSVDDILDAYGRTQGE